MTPENPEFSSDSSRPPRPCGGPILDAIVVGGGLAGLTAARRLKSAGASVVVLEARNRIGGRARSQTLETETTIDLGAQFIGDSHRRISALVDEIGLTRVAPHASGGSLFVKSPGSAPVIQRGDALPLSLFGQWDALWAMWGLGCRMQSFREDIDRLDGMSASEFVRELTLLRESSDSLADYAEGELCITLDRISAYELLDQVASVGGLDGEGGSAQWFLAEGAQPLAQHLADQIDGAVVMSSPVTRIERAVGSWNVCSGTVRHRARSLIVAVPPQLYGRIGLLPHLPENRCAVMEDFEHGHVIKTVLVFERPWWRELGASRIVLSAGSDFNSGMDCSPADGRRGIMVLFSTARSACQLGVRESENARIARAVEWLASLSGQLLSAPVAARSVDWNSEPYSLGGYASRRGIGGWQTAPDLFASLPRLHFAGTETADEWRSFMEGALQSGERAADAVLEDLRE